MKYSFLIYIVLTSFSSFGQNFTKEYIDNYIQTFQKKVFSEYSVSMYEGSYKKKYSLFSKCYSGSIVRNNNEEIVFIDEIYY